MYKLIFADDEILVRKNLTRMFDWESVGFQLLDPCANGHDLLEMTEKEQPDLVITDINMPFINGIEAAKKIKAAFPNIKIVFLTGYDDFEYAQQAIDLRINKYILKPVTAENLMKLLTEIKQELDEEYKFSSDLSMLKSFYHENQQVLQSLFLNNLLLNGDINNTVEEKINALNLSWLAGDRFCVSVIHNEGNHFSEQWDDVSEDIVYFAIYNITKEVVENAGLGSAMLIDGKIAAVFCGSAEDSLFYNKVEACIYQVLAAVERFLKFPVTCGIGRVCDSYNAIRNTYDEALTALGYCAETGENSVISINDVGPYRNKFIAFDRKREIKLIEAMRTGNSQIILEEIQRIITNTAASEEHSMKLCILDLMLGLLREADNFDLDIRKIINVNNLVELMDMDNLNEVIGVIVQSCESISSGIVKTCRKMNAVYMESAKQYILAHYADPELSLDTVSGYVNLSPSHFRSIFTKEQGVSFVKYLTQIRLEKAKKLLFSTNKKIGEIAEETGFGSSQYFSYCFKRHFNVAPNDLRETAK